MGKSLSVVHDARLINLLGASSTHTSSPQKARTPSEHVLSHSNDVNGQRVKRASRPKSGGMRQVGSSFREEHLPALQATSETTPALLHLPKLPTKEHEPGFNAILGGQQGKHIRFCCRSSPHLTWSLNLSAIEGARPRRGALPRCGSSRLSAIAAVSPSGGSNWMAAEEVGTASLHNAAFLSCSFLVFLLQENFGS